jgi:hypothetical protein
MDSENSEVIDEKTKAQLFKTSGIVLSAIFSSVFASGYLITSNLKQLNQTQRAKRVLFYTSSFFVLTLLLIFYYLKI